MVTFLNCFLTIREELRISISATLSLGSLVMKVLPSMTLLLTERIVSACVSTADPGREPLNTPDTDVAAATTTSFPSSETDVTLLRLRSLFPPG